jgi:hypothetical protein
MATKITLPEIGEVEVLGISVSPGFPIVRIKHETVLNCAACGKHKADGKMSQFGILDEAKQTVDFTKNADVCNIMCWSNYYAVNRVDF